MNYPGSFWGMKVIVDPEALEKTAQRLFPESRHRSKRILKKLTKRHGGEFRMRPAIFVVGDRETVICHPEVYEQIKRKIG